VIDASVASAAGQSEHSVSRNCRLFLQEVRTICHHVALSREGYDEWNRHQSRFARAWLRSMRARRKVDELEIEADDGLRARVSATARNERERDEMLKDFHLVEAALQASAPVASLDEFTARGPFRSACRMVRRVRQVVWVNPTVEAERPLEWLQEGAPDEDFRSLGFEVEDRT
jgi:hypothetical protein